MKKWTDEQLAAIVTCGCNVLVSAAAGAGKTAVLVERIIRLLCDPRQPLDIDKLLVVTFTEAAAAEMRERIAFALEKEITTVGRAELTRQLSLLNGATISTLHGFCLEVIKRYFYLLDLDPSFRVADDLEAGMLRQDVIDDVMEEAFAAQDDDFLSLAADYGGKTSDEALTKLVLQLYIFAWSNPWPQEWLAAAVSVYENIDRENNEEALAVWLAPVKEGLRLTLEAAAAHLQDAIRLCMLPDGPYTYETVLQKEMEQVQHLQQLLDGPWGPLRNAWLGIAFDRLPTAKKDVNTELKERTQKLRDRVKKMLLKAGTIYFTRALAEFAAEMTELAPKVRALAVLVQQFAQSYQQAKKQSGLLDFNDLEHYALEILRSSEGAPGSFIPSAAAKELRRRFEHVLVDEYQDINPVQDAILQLVSRQGEDQPNLFMVGDVKQSIYRFRLGEPGLFLAKYRCYTANEEEAPGRKILLSRNFRCRRNVVKAVNYLFEQLMTAEAMEIEYDEEAALVCGAEYPESDETSLEAEPVELLLLDKTPRDAAGLSADGEEEKSEDDDYTSFEREALIVAGKIRELMEQKQFQVFDKETECYRPLSYRDIVILLRSTSNRANRLQEILGKHNIPAYAELSTGYFAATEVETMLSLLQVVDNPRQDIPLAALLRSPFVGCSPEDLAVIRSVGGRKVIYWDALQAAAAADIPGLSEKLQTFLQDLERLRTLARREKLTTFIAIVYQQSRYADYIAGLPDGVKRLANLRALFTRARQFDRFTRQGLARFLIFIEQLRNAGEDLGTARTLGENEDVVRIMSIHKSKGLEFPVVFLCDLGKMFNFQDQRAPLLMHREYGFAPLIVNRNNNTRYPSLPYLSQRLLGEAETRAEELRILYVALTRAREKLFLVGSVDHLEETVASWQQSAHPGINKLPVYQVRRAQTCLDWIGLALGRHPQINPNHCFITQSTDSDARFAITLLGSLSQVAAGTEEQSLAAEIRNAMLHLEPLPIDTDMQIRTLTKERLTFRYPYLHSTVPAKLSVTEIKRRFTQRIEPEGEKVAYASTPWKRPAFLAKKEGPTAAELGTLYHSVLQHLDLSCDLDTTGIILQLQQMVARGTLDATDLPYLKPSKISAFFASAAGQLVCAHKDAVLREWPFTFALPAAELVPGQTDSIIIQGIIDLLIDTPEGFILIDYKTDRLPQGGIVQLAEHYRLQIAYYRRAVETILQKPVLAAYLYSIAAEQSVQIS